MADTAAPQPFPETSWSLVLACRDSTDADRRTRLGELFDRYWRPIFSFVLQVCGRDVHRAQDLTQQFLLHVIEKDTLRGVDRRYGSFRSFIRACLRNFVANARRAEKARKRTPTGQAFSLDAGLRELPSSGPTPEEAFEAAWRRAVLDRVLVRLRAGAEERGLGPICERFVRYEIEDKGRVTYHELCAQLGVDYHHLKHAFHRLRRRFAQLLRVELREQVASTADLDNELLEVFGIG